MWISRSQQAPGTWADLIPIFARLQAQNDAIQKFR